MQILTHKYEFNALVFMANVALPIIKAGHCLNTSPHYVLVKYSFTYCLLHVTCNCPELARKCVTHMIQETLPQSCHL
jgi:hypothetical protein